MVRRVLVRGLLFGLVLMVSSAILPTESKAAGNGQPSDWNRFYYYPYVYYPHNFQNNTKSYNHMYYRYSPSQRIPVYNQAWHNFYPTERPYHRGHHFILDVF